LSFKSQGEAFVAKVTPDGSALVHCSYIGRDALDAASAIAVDNAGNAYVTGWTYSSEATFPVAVGPGLTQGNPASADAFVAKVLPDGSGLAYCGYLGGDAQDIASGIAVDGKGSAFITGQTASSEATFPVSVGPGLTYRGNLDAFVARVKADGSGLDYCGYLGGSDVESGNGIAVDSGGNAYVTGFTASSDLPVTIGPGLLFKGVADAFVAKVSATGSSLVYCGYLGGDDWDFGHAVAVDATGNA
jgi:hypothetical protein